MWRKLPLLFVVGLTMEAGASTQDTHGAVSVAGLFVSEAAPTEVVACGAKGDVYSAKTRAESCAMSACRKFVHLSAGGECRHVYVGGGPRIPQTGSEYDESYVSEYIVAVAFSGSVEAVRLGGRVNNSVSTAQATAYTTTLQAECKVSWTPECSAALALQLQLSEQDRKEQAHARSVSIDYTGYNMGLSFITVSDDSDFGWFAQMNAIRECENRGGKECKIILVVSSEQGNIPFSEGDLLVRVVSEAGLAELQLLLDHGYRAWMPSVRGWSALHEASYRGYLWALRALLLSIPDVQLKRHLTASDGLGNSPLHVALLRSTTGGSQLWVVEELLRNHAPVDVRNGIGLLPLHLAVLQGQVEVVRRILSTQGSIVSDLVLEESIEMALGKSYFASWDSDRDEIERRNSVVKLFGDVLGIERVNAIETGLMEKGCFESNFPSDWMHWMEEGCGAARLQYRLVGGNYDLRIAPAR